MTFFNIINLINLLNYVTFRVIECKGPTNTRVYTVAVYFQGKRLAKASGHSIQEAEMNSAKEALEKSQGILFFLHKQFSFNEVHKK